MRPGEVAFTGNAVAAPGCQDPGVVDIELFDPEKHLQGVLNLCTAEDWPSFPTDPSRAVRVLTAPGVTTVVATEGPVVIGFAELLSDGELQAYLANVAVTVNRRGEGTGRRLITDGLRHAGGERIDLLSEEASSEFYRRFPHFEKPGFRLYPFHRVDAEAEE